MVELEEGGRIPVEAQVEKLSKINLSEQIDEDVDEIQPIRNQESESLSSFASSSPSPTLNGVSIDETIDDQFCGIIV